MDDICNTGIIGREGKEMSSLPTELHKVILHFLDFNSKLDARLVCKHFMKIVEEYVRIVFTFDIHNWCELIETGKELYFKRKLLVSRLGYLYFDDINFTDYRDTVNELKELLICTMCLRGVDFRSCCGLSDEVLTCLPRNLQTLSLRFYSNQDEGITNDSLKLINERTDGGLLELTLRGCSGITDDGMKYVGSKLTRLTLIDIHSITNEGIRHLPSSLISLKLLNLNKDISFAHCKASKNLVSLAIDDINIREEGTQAMGTRLTRLEEPNSDYSITDEVISSTYGRLRHLKLYDRVGVSKIAYGIVSKATQLHSLALKLQDREQLAGQGLKLSQHLTHLTLNMMLIDKLIGQAPATLQELVITG